MSPTRVHPIIYLLIANNYATLYELKHKYDIWDALDLYEICLTNIHNKFVLSEANHR